MLTGMLPGRACNRNHCGNTGAVCAARIHDPSVHDSSLQPAAATVHDSSTMTHDCPPGAVGVAAAAVPLRVEDASGLPYDESCTGLAYAVMPHCRACVVVTEEQLVEVGPSFALLSVLSPFFRFFPPLWGARAVIEHSVNQRYV